MSVPIETNSAANRGSLAYLLDSFCAAKATVRHKDDWPKVIGILERMKAVEPADPYIIQLLALATYKSEQPDAIKSLHQAKSILEVLSPTRASDGETVGLWAALHKRLWQQRQNRQDLEEAIRAYERGFYLRNDYYNGINFAFLLDLRATLGESAEDAITDRVVARRVRRLVLAICNQLLASESFLAADKFWIEMTRAEALIGIGRKAEAEALKQAVFLQAQEPWQMDMWTHQMLALEKLLPSGGVH